MENKITNLVLLAITTFFLSCNKINNKLNGFWAVDYLEYNDKEVLMYGNGLYFEKDSVRFPFLLSDTSRLYNIESQYLINENEDKSVSVIFKTENSIFDGKHYIKFYKVSDMKGNYGLRMVIYSKKLYLEATKSIVFSKEDNFYNQAENFTKYSPPPKYEIKRVVKE